jgi:hypothetical protein
MKAWVTVLLLIVIGILGAWVGYWIGHFVGWSRDAEWPLRIGAGDGAILLSIGLSIASVWVGLWWLLAWPLQRERRLLARGTPGRATILKIWRTGVRAGPRARKRQLGVELEVHLTGHDGYTARTTCLASSDQEEAYRPGAEVEVRYDPSHPKSVAIAGPMAPAA